MDKVFHLSLKWHLLQYITNRRNTVVNVPIPLEELKDNPSALHNTNEKKQERKLEGKQSKDARHCWNIECMGKDYVSDRYIKKS